MGVTKTEEQIRLELHKLQTMDELELLISDTWASELPWRIKALRWVLDDGKE